MMNNIIKLAFCPHCGNQSHQKLIHTQVCEWVSRSLEDDKKLNLGRTYFVASCLTCNHILLYSMWGDNHPEEDYGEIFAGCFLEYPASNNLHPSVPESIREIYREASGIKQSSPNGFAVQIGRALEALCRDKGAVGKNLHQQIDNLVNRHELPDTFAQALFLLKKMRNAGAHYGEEKPINEAQADGIDKFFRAVVEYVYVAPGMLGALKSSMERTELQELENGYEN
jgi:hypothetical protein